MTHHLRILLILLATTSLPALAQDINAAEAHEAVKNGKLTLIDIRTPPEWKQTGVAPGAALINMIHPQGAAGFLNEVQAKVGGDKTAPIALICRTGNRTTQVQRFLQGQGFTQVYNVKEGMAGSRAGPGWLARKLPTESCMAC
ncbi:MAG: rhodanese-like domain-containing protein [Rhodocyclaceae bacterium]|nr:rhodanese-like domain-containing protein [Rhodocyclaceae bacterium]MDZ4214040.1 rhodanese-like domain-containing protein [Rhodocyclaceae bacterium]